PRPGDLVLACPPPAATALARQRGYLGRGPCPGGSKPLGKLVLAAAGDRLELAPTGLVLNRCALPSSATLPSDPSGRRLPHPAPGAYKVTAAQVWLFSPHPRSFDSRYFGPIAVTQLQGLLRPLVVLPAAAMRRWASRLRACAAAP
ncbi:MAG TPA: S26 family signal peptidase, partial [Thermoanaerobaculia bacterium]|nr:S26 family signal peptidase [Thermoanaerobaculia bacterium]